MTEQEAIDYIQSKGFAELEHIHAGQGFWLNLSKSVFLSLSGYKPTQNTLDADSGWHLLAVKSDKNLSTTTLVAEIQEGASFWKWSGSSWNVFLPQEEDNGTSYAQIKGFGILEEIEPGEGFWVNCQ